jgi:hypothetical protein
MQKNTFSLNVLEEIDEEILSRLEQMNIDRRQAKKYIIGNQHNTVTTTYYLLLKQKLMAGGKIITSETTATQSQLADDQSKSKAVTQTVHKSPLRLVSQADRHQVKAIAISPKNSIRQIDGNLIQRVSGGKRQVSRETSPNNTKPVPARIDPIVILSKRREEQLNLPGVVIVNRPQNVQKEEIFSSAPLGPHHQAAQPENIQKSDNQGVGIEQRIPEIFISQVIEAKEHVKVEAEIVSRNSFIEYTQIDSIPESKLSNRSSVLPSDSQIKIQDTDREQNLLRVTSAGSTIKSLATTMNKYSKIAKPNGSSENPNRFTKTFDTERKNSQDGAENEKSIDSSILKSRREQQTRKESTPKVNNIYKNLKRFTSISSKVGNYSFSNKSKGTTKSSSQSREKKSFMRTIDGGQDRSNAATARKVSNPSFQSSSTEDQRQRSFIAFKPTNQDPTEPRKIRNPFSLDLIWEGCPKDLIRDLQASLKKQRLTISTKVALYLHRLHLSFMSLEVLKRHFR